MQKRQTYRLMWFSFASIYIFFAGLLLSIDFSWENEKWELQNADRVSCSVVDITFARIACRFNLVFYCEKN